MVLEAIFYEFSVGLEAAERKINVQYYTTILNKYLISAINYLIKDVWA